MTESQKVEWKIKEVEDIFDALLNRGNASIKGVLTRRIQELHRDLVKANASVPETVEG